MPRSSTCPAPSRQEHATRQRTAFRLLPSAFCLLAYLMLSACGETSAPTATPSPQAGGSTGGPTTINIDEVGFKFVPAEVTVPAGSTVVWTNKDAAKHNVTADDGSFDSGSQEKGATYSRKFDTATTLSYYCKFHGSPRQGMAAILKVEGQAVAGGATTTATTGTSAGAPGTPTAPEPGASPAQPTATTAQAAQPAGTVHFVDDLQLTDQAIISISALPARPTGKGQYAWLLDSQTGANLNLGRLQPDASGAVSLKFSAPGNPNLVAGYDTFEVTNEELEVAPAAPSGDVVLAGQLPPKALVHIRHLLVSFPDTPGKIGLEVGLRAQAQELRRHAEFLRDAQQAGDLPTVKLHAEHLVNIAEGSKGPNYGDLNKDGKVTNPGDGYGLLLNGDQLGYLQGSKDHAELAATAPDATADIKLHAGHVEITVDNASARVTAVRDDALNIIKAANLKATEPLALDILKQANQALQGIDLKGDGQVLPVPGGGGVNTSYQHAQLMAAIPLLPGGPPATTASPAPNPTSAPPAPTETSGAPPTEGGGEVKIDMKDFKFGTGPVTVKAGAKVTWTNLDGAPHTATADNGSFDSGTLQKGQTFSFTFAQPGEIKYYCALHGGPNGQGMASTITVQP